MEAEKDPQAVEEPVEEALVEWQNQKTPGLKYALTRATEGTLRPCRSTSASFYPANEPM